MKLVVVDIDGTLISYKGTSTPRNLDDVDESHFIRKVMDVVEDRVSDGWRVAILTARCDHEKVCRFGNRTFGPEFEEEDSTSVGAQPEPEEFCHKKTRERKSIVLRDLCSRYDEVLFIDDEFPNIQWADDIGEPKLKTMLVGDIPEEKERLTETLHVKHIEDMIFDGKAECDKVVYNLKHILTLLETGSSEVNATIKIDGSPVLTLYKSFPGLEGPGVMLQKFSSIEKAKPLLTPSQIDDEISRKVAKGGDEARLSGLKSILTQALNLSSMIPDNEMWQGEVLFGSKEDLKNYKDSDTGDDWLYVKPGALMYCVPSGSELAETLRNSTFGMVFHTRYDTEMNEHFDVDVNQLGAPSSYFLMAAEEVKVPSEAKIPASTAQVIGEEIENIQTKLGNITSDPVFEVISSTAKYRDFVLDCAEEHKDFNSSSTYEDWADHRVKRFRSKPEKAEKEATELEAFMKKNGDLVNSIIDVINDIVEIKNEYIKAMSEFSKFSTKFDLFGKIRNTSPEGICVTDKDGSIVKLVDKQTFQKVSYYLHGNTNIDLSNLKESRQLREKVEGGKITFYTSSKSDDLISHYLNKDLKFGMNQGLAGGFGSYAVLNNPLGGQVSKFGEEGRKNIYGDYVYQFSISDKRVFYLDYGLFEKSSLSKRVSASQSDYIQKQFEYFKIQVPAPEKIKMMTPLDGVTPAKSMMTFYKYMNSVYYQNEDGTIDSPIDGFIYSSTQDGETIVIWTPYKMVPEALSKNGGPLEPIDSSSPEYKKYMSEMNDKEWSPNEDNVTRTFGGEHNEEKERVYRLLQDSNLDSDSFQMGTFSNIKINPDKTINATYKSNLPISDGFKHYMRMIDTPALDEIAEMGYRFGILDSGLKFGNKSGGGSYRLYHLKDCSEFKMMPREITGGIDLYFEDYDGTELPIKHNGFLRLDRAKVLTIKNLDKYKEIEIGKYVYADADTLEAMDEMGIKGLEDSKWSSREAEEEHEKAEKEAKKLAKKKKIKESWAASHVARSNQKRNDDNAKRRQGLVQNKTETKLPPGPFAKYVTREPENEDDMKKLNEGKMDDALRSIDKFHYIGDDENVFSREEDFNGIRYSDKMRKVIPDFFKRYGGKEEIVEAIGRGNGFIEIDEDEFLDSCVLGNRCRAKIDIGNSAVFYFKSDEEDLYLVDMVDNRQLYGRGAGHTLYFYGDTLGPEEKERSKNNIRTNMKESVSLFESVLREGDEVPTEDEERLDQGDVAEINDSIENFIKDITGLPSKVERVQENKLRESTGENFVPHENKTLTPRVWKKVEEFLQKEYPKVKWYSIFEQKEKEGFRVQWSTLSKKPSGDYWYSVNDIPDEDDEVEESQLNDNNKNIDKIVRQTKGILDFSKNKEIYYKFLQSLGYKPPESFNSSPLKETPGQFLIVSGSASKEDIRKAKEILTNYIGDDKNSVPDDKIVIFEKQEEDQEVGKQAVKNSAFLNVHTSFWNSFLSNVDEKKYIYDSGINNDWIRVIYPLNSKSPEEIKVLKIRPTRGKLGGSNGEVFEQALFVQLYSANKNKHIYSPESGSMEENLIKFSEKLKDDSQFMTNAQKSFNDLIKILPPVVNKFGKKGFYFTALNAGVSIEDETDNKSKQYLQGLFNKMIQKNKEVLDPNNPLISDNLLRKADIVCSCQMSSKKEQKVVYIPISVKLKPDDGNGGERSETKWIRKFNSKFPKQIITSIQDLLKKLETLDQNYFSYLHDMIVEYVGDIGMIYAYSAGTKIIPSIKEFSSYGEYKFKTPKEFKVLNFQNLSKEGKLKFSITVKADKNQTLIFTPSHSNSGTSSFKLDTAGMNFLLKQDDSILQNIKLAAGGKLRDHFGERLFESILNESKENDVIHTPQFKRWFGKSKCVDEVTGEPMILWHGGRFPDTPDLILKATGAESGNSVGTGLWMADNPRVSEQFSSELVNGREGEQAVSEGGAGVEGGKRIALYCKLLHPFEQDAQGHYWRSVEPSVYHVIKDGEVVNEVNGLGVAKEKCNELRGELEYLTGEGKDKYVVVDGDREIFRGSSKANAEKAVKAYINYERIKPPKDTDTIVREARATGKYDGVIIRNINIDDDDPDAWTRGPISNEQKSTYVVAFESNQVKSAFKNTTFDSESDKVYESKERHMNQERLFESILNESFSDGAGVFKAHDMTPQDLFDHRITSKSRDKARELLEWIKEKEGPDSYHAGPKSTWEEMIEYRDRDDVDGVVSSICWVTDGGYGKRHQGPALNAAKVFFEKDYDFDD